MYIAFVGGYVIGIVANASGNVPDEPGLVEDDDDKGPEGDEVSERG
jgi:hypothetical protein